MMSRRSNRFSPEFALLGFLYQGPSHGYELHQRLIYHFGFVWHASQSQTYNILKRLESQGFVVSRVIPQDKLPARQELDITEAGKHRFETWLDQPSKASVHAIRVEFITRLFFIQVYHPERTREMVDSQAEVVWSAMQKLQQQQAQMDKGQSINRLAMELRLKLLGSVAGWLEESRQTWVYEHKADGSGE